jgi:hypothetical protein
MMPKTSVIIPHSRPVGCHIITSFLIKLNKKQLVHKLKLMLLTLTVTFT